MLERRLRSKRVSQQRHRSRDLAEQRDVVIQARVLRLHPKWRVRLCIDCKPIVWVRDVNWPNNWTNFKEVHAAIRDVDDVLSECTPTSGLQAEMQRVSS